MRDRRNARAWLQCLRHRTAPAKLPRRTLKAVGNSHPTTRRALDGYPRDSTEGGKSERCAFHITSGNAARLSDSNIGIPADHAIDRLARRSRIARAADPRSSPHVRRPLSRTLCARSQAVARHITALSTYLGHAHVTDTYWDLQSTPELMAHMSTAGETLHRGVTA